MPQQNPRGTYLKVASGLRQMISDGVITTELPPAKELAAMFRVGLSTVERALNVLKAEGLLDSIQGRGRYVAGTGDRRPPLIRLTGHLRTVNTGDLLPTEPQLADMLGMSRTALRPAIARLEAQGLLGRGCRKRLLVLALPPEPPTTGEPSTGQEADREP